MVVIAVLERNLLETQQGQTVTNSNSFRVLKSINDVERAVNVVTSVFRLIYEKSYLGEIPHWEEIFADLVEVL